MYGFNVLSSANNDEVQRLKNEISQPDLVRDEEKMNSIFGIDNYYEVYKGDLLAANREIILASPAISRGKIEEITALLRDRQESGLRVIIVTWKPDRYGYGDSAYWLELQEKMRQSGFEMNLVDDYCERYCIVDRELVWYGSVNFLGKEDADDNLMRVRSREVVAELMEMTFGGKAPTEQGLNGVKARIGNKELFGEKISK